MEKLSKHRLVVLLVFAGIIILNRMLSNIIGLLNNPLVVMGIYALILVLPFKRNKGEF